MKPQLPLEGPFQLPEERAMIWLSLFALLLITVFASHLGVRRENLIATLPPTEADAPFLIDQIYHQTSDIDVAIIGNCTVWWQFYTPELKAQLEEKYQKPFNVLTFGYNHYGSDLPYLIFKDLLAKRKIKYLILPLPKIEDHNEFPHKNAIQWWLYPKDISSPWELSALGHVRLFGLSFFSSIRREIQAILQLKKSETASSSQVFGFNVQRVHKIDPQNLSLEQTSQVRPTVQALAKERRASSPLLAGDWEHFYQKIAVLAVQHQVQVIFIDSPHAIEFESDEETVTWGFEQFFSPETKLVSLDFKAWKQNLPNQVSERIVIDHNLTYLGARLFTAAMTPLLLEQIHP